jgi:Rps23 Pro-64 3,4-dihydroxylase Tpa1-like proline 4-hydroxylase
MWYPKGTFYKRHLDTFQNDQRRKLSMVLYLNDKDWREKMVASSSFIILRVKR